MRLEHINEKNLSEENKTILRNLQRERKQWYEDKRNGN